MLTIAPVKNIASTQASLSLLRLEKYKEFLMAEISGLQNFLMCGFKQEKKAKEINLKSGSFMI